MIQINTRGECKKFVNLLLENLIIKKEECKIWDLIIGKMDKGWHLTTKGFLNIMKDIETMRLMRGPNKRAKYTLAYFKNEFLNRKS